MKAGWTTKRLGEVCAFDKDQGIHRGLPYVGMEHIESHTGRFIGSRSPQAVKSATFRFSSAHVLYGRLRPYLNKAIAPDFEGHCSTEIFPVKPSPAVDRHYLLYWLLADETTSRINETCSGARMPRADMNEVLGFEFPLPPLPEQRRIVALLDEAFAGLATAAANAERNLDNARELFESHLAGVFSRRGDGWVERRLDSICREITVGFVGSMAREYVASGVTFLRSQNIRPFEISLQGVQFVSRSFHEKLSKSCLRPGDVAVVRTGYPGTAAVIPATLPEANCADLVIVRPSMEVEPEFLAAFFNSTFGKQHVSGSIVGAAQKHFNVGAAKATVLALPPLSEQREIVAKLVELRSLTCAVSQICEQKQAALAALKRSLLHQAFNGEL